MVNVGNNTKISDFIVHSSVILPEM